MSIVPFKTSAWHKEALKAKETTERGKTGGVANTSRPQTFLSSNRCRNTKSDIQVWKCFDELEAKVSTGCHFLCWQCHKQISNSTGCLRYYEKCHFIARRVIEDFGKSTKETAFSISTSHNISRRTILNRLVPKNLQNTFLWPKKFAFNVLFL